MNWVDKVIMLTLTLWVMKCQLSCRGLVHEVKELRYKLQDLTYQHIYDNCIKSRADVMREEYRNAHPEVSTLYRENDVPAAGDRGELHGTGEAMGDEAEDLGKYPALSGSADTDPGDDRA